MAHRRLYLLLSNGGTARPAQAASRRVVQVVNLRGIVNPALAQLRLAAVWAAWLKTSSGESKNEAKEAPARGLAHC